MLAPAPQRPTRPGRDTQFCSDVRAGLLQRGQKSLPPKYFYDTIGSLLFEAITQLPEYGLYRAEQQLLEEHAAHIGNSSNAVNVIELGSGSASKTAPLLRALLQHGPVSYSAIDVSAAALALTHQSLVGLSGLRLHSVQSEYLDGLETCLQARSHGATLVLMLGSSLGNLDLQASARFLQQVRATLRPGDGLLLGADLLKPESMLLAAYDDPLGVTAAFNLNLLARMNRELGADFELKQFRHLVRFNRDTHDVEMHLESLIEQQVRFADGFIVSLRRGETIHTENSHKYSLAELDRLTVGSGFRVAAQWINQQWQFVSRLDTAI